MYINAAGFLRVTSDLSRETIKQLEAKTLEDATREGAHPTEAFAQVAIGAGYELTIRLTVDVVKIPAQQPAGADENAAGSSEGEVK